MFKMNKAMTFLISSAYFDYLNQQMQKYVKFSQNYVLIFMLIFYHYSNHLFVLLFQNYDIFNHLQLLILFHYLALYLKVFLLTLIQDLS